MCSSILTWNSSSQPIFSSMSTFFHAQKTCLLFKPAEENPSELWRWLNLQCYHCDTELEVVWDGHPLEEDWKPVFPSYAQRKSYFFDHSMSPPSGCTICQMSYDRSILRGGKFSYSCHTTFLRDLRRLWSLQDLGMLWWHCALLGYGSSDLCFDFSGPKPDQDNFSRLIQQFLCSPLPDFSVFINPLLSWSCK